MEYVLPYLLTHQTDRRLHCCRLMDDMNTNALNVQDGTYQRPSSAPIGSTPDTPGSPVRVQKGQVSSEPHETSGSQIVDVCSSRSLPRSPSLETPFGVVKQTSPSNMEPLIAHPSRSNESFKREFSAHKMHSMPVLEEDENTTETGENVMPGKTSDKSKIKRNKYQPVSIEEIEIEEKDSDNWHDCLTESEHKEQKNEISGFKKLTTFFQNLVPCTRANKNDLEPDNLIDFSR